MRGLTNTEIKYIISKTGVTGTLMKSDAFGWYYFYVDGSDEVFQINEIKRI